MNRAEIESDNAQMNIQIVEYNGVRVITTKQAAEIYRTDPQKITNNFNRNKRKYKEGKHFIRLVGDDLSKFKTTNHFDLQSRAKILYLWTERGALLLAKSINTDVAWTAYERLVDFYFEKKSEQTAQTEQPEPERTLSDSLYHTSSTPVPKTVNWFQRNNRRMGEICERANAPRKTLYHHILVRLGEEYDLAAANRIYAMENGYPPRYAIDIVSYFPELAALADEYLDKMEVLRTERED